MWVYNSFLGKQKICEAMLEHTAARVGLSSAWRNIGKKFGFLYIRLFGYPFAPLSRILARKTLKMFDKSNKGLLLDVGCSHGAFDFELARRGYTVVAVDINRESISVGNKIKNALGYKNITFRHMDILSNDFHKKQFDVIIMFEALEHIKDDASVIREFHRILKDEGLLLLAVPYAEDIQEYEEPVGVCKAREGGYVCVGEGSGHYRNGYNLDSMRTLLKKNGFTILSWQYLCLSMWPEASIFSFPFKFPLSIILTHFSKNRLELKVMAQKNIIKPVSIEKGKRLRQE
jgi:2-polyprenyl-3-methyl-5-hydroxy-6-metoxy-1,4-benzoquinol methylase